METTDIMQKILIVDDVPANIKVLIDALKNLDYEILVATSGAIALKIATSENPDLILLDVMMPEMDGYEVCIKLKTHAATKKIPVIFITSRGEEECETKGLKHGAVDYIIKPISPPIVQARVKTHLELKRQRDILENLSNLDGLTGIPNRRRFDEFFEQEWQLARRGCFPLSLIMIDIDYFKLFNDNYGHLAGDDCLKQVAQALAKTIERKTDLLARYGGEEFICILPLTDGKGAVVVANKLRESVLSLDIRHAYSATADHITISQGVATQVPSKHTKPIMLIEAADKALYQAKACGRNQVKVI
jgi:diguanylate cyclase (GGDEF)-like protein